MAYALVWWASLIGAGVLLSTGHWGWAIALFAVGNIIFGIGRRIGGAKVTGSVREGVESIGYNDGTPAQVAKAQRAYRLLAVQSHVNPRHHLYPAELEQDVSAWGFQSRSTETPIVLLAAWSIAAKQAEASAQFWGQAALETETDGMPVAKLANELRNAFPDWYAKNNDTSVPAPLNQRLHAYILLLVAFALTRKDEIAG